MKKIKKFEILLLIVLCVQLYMFTCLPDVIPVHWNINWEVDSYGSKYIFLVLIALPIVTYYGMDLTYKIDPKLNKIENRKKSYEYSKRMLSLFFVVLGFLFFYLTNNPTYDATVMMGILFGGFFVVLGNELPKFPQNYYLGIRTSFTLENEEVWRKTHRFGGYIFCLTGIVIIISAIFFKEYLFFVLMGMLVVSMVLIFVYSYKKYNEMKEEEKC